MTARRELACARLRAHAHLCLAYAGQAEQLGLPSNVWARWMHRAHLCFARLAGLS